MPNNKYIDAIFVDVVQIQANTTFEEDAEYSKWRSSKEYEVHNEPGYQDDC